MTITLTLNIEHSTATLTTMLSFVHFFFQTNDELLNFWNHIYLRLHTSKTPLAMANQSNENRMSTHRNVDQTLDDDATDAIASHESNRNAKQKRKIFASIVSIEGNEFVDIATNSYRIIQNAFKRRKIEIVRVDDVHTKTEDLHVQIDDLKAALAAERNLIRVLK